jgi:hypothetical protein
VGSRKKSWLVKSTPNVTVCLAGDRAPTFLNVRVDYEIGCKNETALPRSSEKSNLV